MDNEKWPAFITGFVLGILVAGGVLGTFGWRKYQQVRAMAAEQAAMAAEEAARARAAEQMARELLAELAHDAEKPIRENERKALKALEEALNNIKLKAGQPGDKKDK
jgi:predicted negative regulator of RcsB-dependent stress response